MHCMHCWLYVLLAIALACIGMTVGIRLDWQIEAERVHERSGEDPTERRRRRSRRVQLLLFTIGLLIGIGGLIAVVMVRLNTVDTALRQTLIDAAQTEITTLRIGDYTGFIALQRSASDDWLRYQSNRYQAYQDLKNANQIAFGEGVIDATVDGQRGRVVVAESRSGVPYRTVWFYWRYTDGWHHVPSDFTFWGDPGEIVGEAVTVQHKGLDAELAQAMASQIDAWWQSGCTTLGCGTLTPLVIRVLPDPTMQLGWDISTEPEQLTLIVPSPLANLEGTPAAPVFPISLQDQIALRLAERQFALATRALTPLPTADAAWLKQAIIEWLAASYTGRVDAAQVGFIASLKANYGDPSVGLVARALTPTTDISVVSLVLNQPLATLTLDWRSFFQWRLNVEKALLADNRIDDFVALWDTGNPDAQASLRARLQTPTQQAPQVLVAAISPGVDGVPLAIMQANLGDAQVIVTFRLVAGTWKRVG
jgi:hypothetical protein